mgnify:CR=1 FL=1
MAITNLPTALTSAGNQGDAGDYSTAASSVFQIDYSGLDYTPKTTDDYKNDFEEELQVFINGTRIYRLSTDTGIDDAGGLSTAQKSRLTNLNSSFGNEPWDIVTGTKKIQINQTHTAFGDSDSNNPGYPALNTWTIIKIIRIKPDKTTLATDFQSASVLTEAELDNAFSETFHMAQEAIDTSLDSIAKGADNVWDAQSLRIKNVATPSVSTDAANKAYVDGSSNTGIVAGISADVTTVAGISANVTTVAGIDSNVTTVAGIASNVTTVATNNTNVTNVGGDIANVNTVAGSIANVNTVAGSIANVNTVATNIGTISAKVSKSGDTMTGLLTLSGAPTADNHASTKAYTDSQATALALALG